jgi:hypothetical protein
LFAEKVILSKPLPASGIDGISFAGNIPSHNCNLKVALPKLTETKNKWFYVKRVARSAFATVKVKTQNKVNPYKKLFKQGATIVPRTFYFVQLTQDVPPDWEGRTINVKTSENIQHDAKVPWKGLNFEGKVDSKFIFRTALSKSILPFSLFKPDLIVLPITIENNNTVKKIKLFTPLELLQEGYSDTSKWFQNAENIWKIKRTENNKNINTVDYLNWQNKLKGQNLNAPYLVLYNASAKDANATIVKRKDFDLEFIVESKCYWFATENVDEAYYLTAILNSTTPNEMMKPFQTQGLFGPRDIHKLILDIYYPKYDSNDSKHICLAYLSKISHAKTSDFLKSIDAVQIIAGLNLGRIRLDIKKHLASEMKEIDEIVKKIIG